MYSNAVQLRYIGQQHLGILERRETHNPIYSRSMETSYPIGKMVSIGLHSIRQIQNLNYTLGIFIQYYYKGRFQLISLVSSST